MKQWDISEASRRLHGQIRQPDTRIVWFLGAGCSISSGIPGAGQLVRDWMDGLRGLKGERFADWAADSCAGWEQDPASYYGVVIEERFAGNPRARQEEIARLVKEKEPGFGYACLAQLMSHDEFGRRNNVAFTTNFDDLIADALYLYTQQKPLTVVHEALAGFLRSSESTPLVVKLHGDSQLAPKNTVEETTHLDDRLIAALRRVLRDAIFVFIGYGGNDASIASFLQGCRRDEIAGAYWVGKALPGDEQFHEWFTSLEGAVHVDHQDFDAFMAELHAEFELGAPDFERFNRLKESYEDTARKLVGSEGTVVGTSARGSKAADRAIEYVNARQLSAEAAAVGLKDLELCTDLHRQALEAAPYDPVVLGRYGNLLVNQGRVDEFGGLLRRALDHEPSNTSNRRHLVTLLVLSGQHVEAESILRAMEPLDLQRKRLLAVALSGQGRLEEALAVYRERVEEDPTNARVIGSLAELLAEMGRMDEAAATYRRALEAERNPTQLVLAADVLAHLGQDDEADALRQEAVSMDPSDENDSANLARLMFGWGRRDEARRYLRSAFAHGGLVVGPLSVELELYCMPTARPGTKTRSSGCARSSAQACARRGGTSRR